MYISKKILGLNTLFDLSNSKLPNKKKCLRPRFGTNGSRNKKINPHTLRTLTFGVADYV